MVCLKSIFICFQSQYFAGHPASVHQCKHCITQIQTAMKIASIFKTGSTVQCPNAMLFGFTSLTSLYCYVALDMYISELSGTCFSFSFIEVSGKIFIKFCGRACNLWIAVRYVFRTALCNAHCTYSKINSILQITSY